MESRRRRGGREAGEEDMNTAVTPTHYESSWQIAPSNAGVGFILGVLFL